MQHFKTENYKDMQNLHDYPKPKIIGTNETDTNTTPIWCNDEVQLDASHGLDPKKGAYNNPDYMSINQRLVGGPNPKTLIAPVVPPPIADLEYWKTNNMVTHSAVNEETEINVGQSGYLISEPCKAKYREDYHTPLTAREALNEARSEARREALSEARSEARQVNFTMPYIKDVRPNESGWVNTACGYNPEQLEQAGLPTNLASGNCAQDPAMKQYNENLFTDIVQPGVYTTSQIVEPINQNIGISFQQQFPPLTSQIDPISGDILYTQHDPRIMEPLPSQPMAPPQANPSNVYDPRLSGYGTSYRAYTDNVTGQTRFFYDDVNAIRMPNYLVRSRIDNEPYADTYAPIPQGAQYGNPMTDNIRELANKSWLDNSVSFRNELQERLMRKNNANAWQRRQAPINTGGQR